jgi:hypothetical protein
MCDVVTGLRLVNFGGFGLLDDALEIALSGRTGKGCNASVWPVTWKRSKTWKLLTVTAELKLTG